tara:strand:+ start:92 stop:358 length:267 start_codon:yes stop_codon:yes gene_type:complete
MISGVGNGPFFLMKVLLTRNVAVKGQHLGEGETHDLNEVDAGYLIRNGKAIEAVEECPMPEASLPPAPPTASKISSKPKKVKESVDSQ